MYLQSHALARFPLQMSHDMGPSVQNNIEFIAVLSIILPRYSRVVYCDSVCLRF